MTTCSACGHSIGTDARFCPSCGARIVVEAPNQDGLLGRTLNEKYRILSKLGEGSMGTVYLGEHISLQKKVALKVLRPDLEVGEEALTRFQREGIAAGKFSHPNAIQVFDFDRADERLFYLAMEYVEGHNLKDFLAREGRLAPVEAIDLVHQILSALAGAHERGIVHRDLKPENIMVTRESSGALKVKVLDFGLSKLVHLPMEASLATQPGRILGTPLYMAPEQGVGEEVDHRSDLYAVGLILYELITGVRPFQGASIIEIIGKQASQAPPLLSEADPVFDLPPLDDVIQRALEKGKADRYQSAAEMLEDLDAIDYETIRLPEGSVASSSAERARHLEATSASKRGASQSMSRSALRRSTLQATTPEAEAAPSGSSRRFALIGLAVALAATGLWWFGFAGAGGPDVALVSQKAPEHRTEDERRYVDLLASARRELRGGDHGRALDRILEARALPCADAESFLVRADIYRDREDLDTALADYREALSLAPQYAAAAAGVGWIELDQGRLDEARATFEGLAELQDGAALASSGLGAVHYLRGEEPAARERLEAALALDDEVERAAFYLGSLLLDEDDGPGAVKAFVAAKRSTPRSAVAAAGLGRAYLLDDQRDKAETQLREALELDASLRQAAQDLSALLVEDERFGEVLDVFEPLVERHPEWTRTRLMIAIALDAEDRTEEAASELRRAIDTGSGDTLTRTFLGTLYHRVGDREAALSQYDEVLGQDPYAVRASVNRGLVLFELERFEEAATEFARAVDLDPESTLAHYGLGILQMDYVGDRAAAREHLRAYRRLGGTDTRVNAWLARLGG